MSLTRISFNVTADARLVAVLAAGFAAFLDLHAPQTMLPTLVREFDARHDTVGLTVSAATLAIAIASPLAGVIVARFRRRIVLGVCCAGLVLTTLLCAMSPSIWALIGWRFVQGLFIPPVLALTMAYIGEAWPRQEVGRIMAAYVSANVVGGFSGRFLAGLVTAHAGWRPAFVLLALLSAMSAWMVLRAMPDSGPAADAAADESPSDCSLSGRYRRLPAGGLDLGVLLEHLRDRRLRGAFAAGFSVLFALVGMFTYVTFHLSDAPFHLGPDALGALFAVYLVGVVVTPLAGRLIEPLGHGRVIVGSTLLSICGALITLVPSVPAVVVGLVICSSAAFVSQSAATGFVSEVAGERRSSALGLYLSFYYLGGSLGAALPGLLWTWSGWPGTVALLVAVDLCTIALARRFPSRAAH